MWNEFFFEWKTNNFLCDKLETAKLHDELLWWLPTKVMQSFCVGIVFIALS